MSADRAAERPPVAGFDFPAGPAAERRALAEQLRASREFWDRLGAPLAMRHYRLRQDGQPRERDGRAFARFVVYVDAATVRERLDTEAPGQWHFALEPLPALLGDGDVESAERVTFKGRLTIAGVVREDVGSGRSYKAAASDALKRVAQRFGIGHELHAMPAVWVEMTGTDRRAQPKQKPTEVLQQLLAQRAERAQRRAA